MKRTILYIPISLIFVANLVAQPRFGNERGNLNYRSDEMLVNPAYAGSIAGASTISLSARMQWIEVDGGPMSQNLQFQTATIARGSGLGLSLYNDSYGVNKNMQLGLYYAYKIPLKRGMLSFGLQVGALICGTDAVTDLYEPNDPVFAGGASRSWGFNSGAGAYYRTDKWFAGFSIPQLLTNDFDVERKLKNDFKFDRLHYYLAGGYTFNLNEVFTLQPVLLLELSQSASTGYEFMLTAAYKKRFDFGIGLAADAYLQLSVGVGVLKNLSLRYQYGHYTGNLRNDFSGIHFISLVYVMNKRR